MVTLPAGGGNVTSERWQLGINDFETELNDFETEMNDFGTELNASESKMNASESKMSASGRGRNSRKMLNQPRLIPTSKPKSS